MNIVAEQGVVLGIAVFLAWPPVIFALLLLHLLNSYVHLGRSPLLDFASLAGRNLLKPLSGLPLQLGRVNFSPVVAGRASRSCWRYRGAAFTPLHIGLCHAPKPAGAGLRPDLEAG